MCQKGKKFPKKERDAYFTAAMLFLFSVLSSYIIANSPMFPESVVEVARGVLVLGFGGLFLATWKHLL